MILVKNMLIQRLGKIEDEDVIVERILYVEGKDSVIVTIDIFAKKALPKFRKYNRPLAKFRI